MVLKYTDGNQYNTGQNRLVSRLPPGAMPISTAPAASATPIVVYEPTGRGYWALKHRDVWQKLQPFTDHKTRAVSFRMNGEWIQQPVAWLPRPPQRRR
jgi:hypothetical protein